MRTLTVVIGVQLSLAQNMYVFFNSNVVNFVSKTNEGEVESIALLVFVLWWCLNHRWMRGSEMGQNSYLGPAEITCFSSWDFRQSNKHHIFQHLLTQYFCVLFLWTITVSDFRPLQIYKNLDLPLSAVTFTVNNRADNHFYKCVCFKYYAVWNLFFLY